MNTNDIKKILKIVIPPIVDLIVDVITKDKNPKKKGGKK